MYPETIETPTLLLRRLHVSDATACYERYTSDPEVTRFMSWKTNLDVSETEAFAKQATDLWESGDESIWGICLLRDDGLPDQLLPWGTIGLRGKGHAREIGYVLAMRHWGRGVMTEAARAVVAKAWKDPAVWRVSAHCHADNIGSARVLERCGMKLEGRVRRAFVLPQIGPQPQDALLWAQTRDDLPAS